MNNTVVIPENPGTAPKQLPKMGPQKPFLTGPAATAESLDPETARTQRELFSQSFVQSNGLDRRRRRGSALVSIVLEGFVIAFLFLLPFLTLDVLPTDHLAAFLIAPPPPPPPPPPPAPSVPKMSRIVSEMVNGQLLAPSRIPRTVKMVEEGGVPGGQASGVLGSLLSSTHSAAPPAAAIPKRITISTGISEGLLLHRVEPEYPTIAKRARVEGIVRLKAIISREGVIENLQVIDGHPLLVPSAMEAAKQWRYRPYMLNGNPVEVETFINVHFLLG